MSDDRAAALSFLKSHQAGVLSSVTPEGGAHGSAVFYVADESFNIFFLTLKTSRKFANLQAHPRVAFTVGRQDVPQTLQLEGDASVLQHPEDIGEHAADLMKVLTSNTRYYAPLTKLDTDATAIVWIKPKSVRWADYTTAAEGTQNVIRDIPLI